MLNYALTFPTVGTFDCTQTAGPTGTFTTETACNAAGHTVITSPHCFSSQSGYWCSPASNFSENNSCPNSMTTYANAAACVSEQCNNSSTTEGQGSYMCNSRCTDGSSITQCLEAPHNVTDASVCIETAGEWGCVCRYPLNPLNTSPFQPLSLFDENGAYVTTQANNCIGYTAVNTGVRNYDMDGTCTISDSAPSSIKLAGECRTQGLGYETGTIMICPDNTPCTIGAPLMGNTVIPDSMYVCASDLFNFPTDHTKWRQCIQSTPERPNLGTVTYNDASLAVVNKYISQYPPVATITYPVAPIAGPGS